VHVCARAALGHILDSTTALLCRPTTLLCLPTPRRTLAARARVQFVADLEEDDRSPEELAAVAAAREAMDMDKVAAHKAEGNEFFRKSEFKEACAAYLIAIRMLDKGSTRSRFCGAPLVPSPHSAPRSFSLVPRVS